MGPHVSRCDYSVRHPPPLHGSWCCFRYSMDWIGWMDGWLPWMASKWMVCSHSFMPKKQSGWKFHDDFLWADECNTFPWIFLPVCLVLVPVHGLIGRSSGCTFAEYWVDDASLGSEMWTNPVTALLLSTQLCFWDWAVNLQSRSRCIRRRCCHHG